MTCLTDRYNLASAAITVLNEAYMSTIEGRENPELTAIYILIILKLT